MELYSTCGSEGFSFYDEAEDSDGMDLAEEVLNSWGSAGRSLVKDRCFLIHRSEYPGAKELPIGDFVESSWGAHFLISPTRADEIVEFLGDDGSFYDVSTTEGPMKIFIPHGVEAILRKTERDAADRAKNGGSQYQYLIEEDILRSRLIFCDPREALMTFVTEEFRQKYHCRSWTGLSFLAVNLDSRSSR